MQKRFVETRSLVIDNWLHKSDKLNVGRHVTEYELGDEVWVVRPEIWHVYSKPSTFEVKFKAKENWIGPYSIYSAYENKPNVYVLISADGAILTYPTLNGKRARNFHVRYLRPYVGDMSRPKELPPVFTIDSDDEMDSDEQNLENLSSEELQKRKQKDLLMNNNIGQLPRSEQNLVDGYIIDAKEEDISQFPRDQQQMKMGTFVEHVLKPPAVDLSSDDEASEEKEEDEDQNSLDEAVAQIILNDDSQKQGTSLLHQKKIHPWLLSNYIDPLPALSSISHCLWKPLALYVDVDQYQYLLVQIIQKQQDTYHVVENKLINSYQINGAHVYKLLGRDTFKSFNYNKILIPVEFSVDQLKDQMNYMDKIVKLHHVLKVPDVVSDEQPMKV